METDGTHQLPSLIQRPVGGDEVGREEVIRLIEGLLGVVGPRGGVVLPAGDVAVTPGDRVDWHLAEVRSVPRFGVEGDMSPIEAHLGGFPAVGRGCGGGEVGDLDGQAGIGGASVAGLAEDAEVSA